MKIFFDGGCRPNPGTMEIAVVVKGQETILPDLGQGTSEDAEWLALIHAIEIAQALEMSDFVLMGDAVDVVAKASGSLKCNGRSAQHLQRFRALAARSTPRIRHIKRSQNLAGIALASRHPR